MELLNLTIKWGDVNAWRKGFIDAHIPFGCLHDDYVTTEQSGYHVSIMSYIVKREYFTSSKPQCITRYQYPDGKVHGANMGPTLVLSFTVGPHVGSMNLGPRVGLTFLALTDISVNENPAFEHIGGRLMVFTRKLKHRHTENNCAPVHVTFQLGAKFDLPHTPVDPGTTHTMKPHSDFVYIVPNAPPSLGQKFKSEWYSLWHTDYLSARALMEERDVSPH